MTYFPGGHEKHHLNLYSGLAIVILWFMISPLYFPLLVNYKKIAIIQVRT